MKGHQDCKLRDILTAVDIQDLLILPNGVLLSCSYDNLIIAWNYLKPDEERRIGTIKRREELKCMDYIDW